MTYFMMQSNPGALRPCQIPQKGVHFQVCIIKVGNLGVMQKPTIEGDHQPLTFGFIQLFDANHPGVANDILFSLLLPLKQKNLGSN